MKKNNKESNSIKKFMMKNPTITYDKEFNYFSIGNKIKPNREIETYNIRPSIQFNIDSKNKVLESIEIYLNNDNLKFMVELDTIVKRLKRIGFKEFKIKR